MYRKFTFVSLYLLVFALAGQSQISATDKQFVVAYLEESRFALERVLAKVNDEDWLVKPDSTRWSIAQICDHIQKAEKAVFYNLNNNILKKNAQVVSENQTEIDDMIITLASDRSIKMTAPESIRPVQDAYRAKQEFLLDFHSTRDKTVAFSKSCNLPLRQYLGFFSPMQMEIDAVQWLIVISAHTQRHIKQIEEVKKIINTIDN